MVMRVKPSGRRLQVGGPFGDSALDFAFGEIYSHFVFLPFHALCQICSGRLVGFAFLRGDIVLFNFHNVAPVRHGFVAG